MGIDRARLIPTSAPLVGFRGTRVFPIGSITLPVTVGDYPQELTRNVMFLVVDCSSAYNGILGWPTLNSWKAATSTYHLMIKFLTDYGIGELRGNQATARECYIVMLEMEDHHQTMCVEEQRTVAEPVEELEEITLDESKPERTTRIGTLACQPVRQALTTFLRRNQDVFAWNHEDMPEIDPSVIVQKLNVNPSTPPVRQKKRVFAHERDRAIAQEVRKLLEAGFIREVYYPEWLANVVMVKKASGKWRMCVDFTDLNKACPKDSYPLLRIDALVDSTARHQLLSFMDAFSGYNQIMMEESD
nr:transposon ty3-g gag-pol polyprotein [Quercus suber]